MIDSNGNPTPSGTYPGSLHLLHCWRRHPSCVCTCAWCVCIHHGCDTNKKGSSSSILWYTYDGIAIAPSLLACLLASLIPSWFPFALFPRSLVFPPVQFSSVASSHLTSPPFYISIYIFLFIFLKIVVVDGRTDAYRAPPRLHFLSDHNIQRGVGAACRKTH